MKLYLTLFACAVLTVALTTIPNSAPTQVEPKGLTTTALKPVAHGSAVNRSPSLTTKMKRTEQLLDSIEQKARWLKIKKESCTKKKNAKRAANLRELRRQKQLQKQVESYAFESPKQ